MLNINLPGTNLETAASLAIDTCDDTTAQAIAYLLGWGTLGACNMHGTLAECGDALDQVDATYGDASPLNWGTIKDWARV